MGSAMAMPFSDTGKTVRLVGTHLDEAIIENIRSIGTHPKLKVTMPKSILVYGHQDFAKAVGDDTDIVLLGVSSAGVDWAIDKLVNALKKPVPVVMITKGMRPMADTMRALPDYVAEQLKARLGFVVPVAAIGGPCIAGELAARRPTGTVIVSHDMGLATRLADAFACDYYFPQTSIDMMGVEICAAFKNFFAITVGWAIGRGTVMAEAENKAGNNNAASILFDQAIREMMVLARALGGSAESVWGMPGAGDLYVTCQAGRNSRLGHALGRGLNYADAMTGPLKGETVEGAELGLAVAKSVQAMVSATALDGDRLPLTLTLIDTLKNNMPFDPPWQRFHRV